MTRPRRCRSSGTCAMRASRRSSALVERLRSSGRPSSLTAPLVAGRMPASTSRSSDWPLPATPAMPRISPARTSKLTDFSRSTPLSSVSERFSTASATAPGFASPFSTRSSTRRPTISSASSAGLVSAVVERLHHLAAAHDADRVGHRHDLAQLVGDEDDRLALLLEVLEDAEQVVGLRGGQDAGRLVEDQDVALAVERLQDLHPLLQPDRELAHHGVGVDLELVLVLEPLQLRPRLGERGAQQPPVLGAEDDVLEHGEGLDQHEVLMHHADPGADRRQAVGDRHGLAVDADLAGVGLVEAVEDRHQRRLAGAVLADDAVDGAAADGEVDVPVGLDRPEALGDADELDGERRAAAPRRRLRPAGHRRQETGQAPSVE